MSSIKSVLLFLLSMKMLVSAMVEKRAASCDMDPSLPCECINPFLGTENFFLGEAARLCESAKACYVKNLSGCADSRQSRGGGRCQSKEACKPQAVSPTPGTPSPVSPTPVVPTLATPTTVSPTPVEPTPEVPVDEGTAVDLSVKPALVSKCPGTDICECISASEGCTMCEVGCTVDCHDLSTDGTKCFSGLACKPDLLFEIDNGLECPAPGDAVVEPVDPTVVEPVVPTVEGPGPVDSTVVERTKICECVVVSERVACTKCEVDCLADCNDMSREGSTKCFSEFACNKGLLFELGE